MALPDLIKRYFHDPMEEDDEARKKAEADAAMFAGFLRTDYYPEFRKHLETLRRAHEPRPGAEGSMLYQCGVRDGLDLVLAHLDDILRRVKEQHE